jgi:GH15 family glucan-1,4-alpha-glucosidase
MSMEIYPPIADYALLSDCHSGALVSKDGSVDWCTFHRFEARPVFARILDWAKAGFFRIAPLDDEYQSTRRYLPGANVLETTFRTPSGTLVLTDFFAFRVPAEGQDAHSAHPDHQLIRLARCTDGEVAVKVKLVPRFDYGLTTPRLETLADDLVVVYGGADALVLQSELPFGHAERSATQGNRTLQAGEEAFVVLTYQLPHELKPHRLNREEVQAKLEETTSAWTAWTERCTYEGPEFLGRVAGAVIDRWREPDQGIWEIRGEPRHFTYSKVMAWVALDRVIRIAELDGREGALDEWRVNRDELRGLIERDGVDPGTGAFVQSFGDGGKLDASNLMIPIVGFVGHDDSRARATFERTVSELSADGFVYRYVTDGVDGLSGEEATFAICSFWLVECLARAGDGERARELFERLLGFCNDVGLLAEEIDPHSGELIGNFPQAFSHVGLIQAAIALDLPQESMTAMTGEKEGFL